jgi:hypothetical protein
MCVTLTETPATELPLGSVTTILIEDAVLCAKAVPADNIADSATAAHKNGKCLKRRNFFTTLPFVLLIVNHGSITQ